MYKMHSNISSILHYITLYNISVPSLFMISIHLQHNHWWKSSVQWKTIATIGNL